MKYFKMAAKMAAENLNLLYLSSAFRYKDELSVDSYEKRRRIRLCVIIITWVLCVLNTESQSTAVDETVSWI